MRIFWHLLAATLPYAGLGALLGFLATVLWLEDPVVLAGEQALSTAALWLHAPAALATLAGLARWIEIWPTLARARPGGALVARSLGTVFSGTGAAALGTLLGLIAILTTVGAVFPAFLAARGRLVLPPRATAPFAPARDTNPMLDAGRARVELTARRAIPIIQVRLSPAAVQTSEAPLVPTTVRVTARADGKDHALGEITIAGSYELATLSVPSLAVESILLERIAGSGMALWFLPDSVVGLAEHAGKAWLASAFAALGYLWPAMGFVALALLARGLLAPGVLLALLLATILLLVPFDIVPTAAGITALARGQAPLEALRNPTAAASFSGIVLAMILAMTRRASPDA